MERGWNVWVAQAVAVPCTLLMLSACTSTARSPSGAATVGGAAIGTGPLDSGRSYGFSQMLARAQERNAELEQQLEERGRQIDQLQNEVQQLRQQEGELRAALGEAGAGGGAAAPTAAGVAAAEPEARAEPQPTQETAPPTTAAPPQEASSGSEDQGDPAAVASLRAALVQEQTRREAVESELERLKEETSTPALADPNEGPTDLVTAKEQITELRNQLTEERIQRERMADDLRVLQERAEYPAPPAAPPEETAAAAPDLAPQDPDLQSRIDALRAEKDAIMESFNRSLAASQRRTADLEQQLAASQAAAAAAAAGATAPPGEPGVAATPSDSEAASIRAENSALRARLDEEHRRTEDLAAKLRVATRVTDLIFKMQAQQAQAQPLRAP